MIKHIFIIVPAFTPAGPVKGAVALANSLVKKHKVSLVSLKGGRGFCAPIDALVELIDLSCEKSFFAKVRRYKKLLHVAGDRNEVASISFTFSADMANLLCRRYAVTCNSVRGNLVKNYQLDYGLLGVLLACFHLWSMRFFDQIVVMTAAMQSHVQSFAHRTPVIISNFIDEPAIEKYRVAFPRREVVRFVFVGSLSTRKQPLLLVHAIAKLVEMGYPAHLDIVGDGDLRKGIEALVRELGMVDRVILHGHLAEPYAIVAVADVFVLPSLSEGLSRASLEALYLGVPCVMRSVDGNAELIERGINGCLFDVDNDLGGAMLAAAQLVNRESVSRQSLLPEKCRQAVAAQQYLLAIGAA